MSQSSPIRSVPPIQTEQAESAKPSSAENSRLKELLFNNDILPPGFKLPKRAHEIAMAWVESSAKHISSKAIQPVSVVPILARKRSHEAEGLMPQEQKPAEQAHAMKKQQSITSIPASMEPLVESFKKINFTNTLESAKRFSQELQKMTESAKGVLSPNAIIELTIQQNGVLKTQTFQYQGAELGLQVYAQEQGAMPRQIVVTPSGADLRP